jgi:RNA polymerase sigma-70 factor (ECF subfamily)
VGEKMDEDKELVIKAKQGDKNSFEKLILKYTKGLYGFVFNMLGQEQAAQDVVQETFFKAFSNLHSFNLSKVFSTWIYTIAKNSTLNYIKANKKYNFIDAEDCASDSNNPEAVFINNEASKSLVKAIDRLSENHRTLIYLKYINKLSYEEISKTLNISKSVVESRLYTARQKLSILLSGGE